MLIVVVVVAVADRGGPAEPRETPVVGPPEETPAPAPKVKTAAERILDLELAVLSAASAGDVSRLEKLNAEGARLGANRVETMSAEAAVKIDGDARWARETLGFSRYDGRALPDDDEVMYPTADWTMLVAARRECWVTAERLVEVKAAEARFLAHQDRVETDAHYRKVCQYRGMMAKDPVFKDWDYTIVESRPYLVFVQRTDDPAKAAALEKRAQEKAAVLRRLHDCFVERFGERFRLPKLESDEYQKDTILRAWIFADRASFIRYHKIIGMPIHAGIGAYYNPQDQWMLIPEGVASGMPVPGQDMDTNVTIHEGTHQLIHHFMKRLIEHDTGEELVWTDHRLRSRSMWFQEGIAEFFGSAVRQGSTWDLFSMPDKRMPSQFYGQSWALLSFLLNDDRYRAKMLEYMENEFHGRSGLDIFLKVFGLENPAGSQLEKDYVSHCQGLLRGR